nr:MAG: nonstructural polyprotein [Tuatara cloaca-associated dicistrovirus-3]
MEYDNDNGGAQLKSGDELLGLLEQQEERIAIQTLRLQEILSECKDLLASKKKTGIIPTPMIPMTDREKSFFFPSRGKINNLDEDMSHCMELRYWPTEELIPLLYRIARARSSWYFLRYAARLRDTARERSLTTYGQGYMGWEEQGWFALEKHGFKFVSDPLVYLTRGELAFIIPRVAFSQLQDEHWAYTPSVVDAVRTATWGSESLHEALWYSKRKRDRFSAWSLLDVARRYDRSAKKQVKIHERNVARRERANVKRECYELLDDAKKIGEWLRSDIEKCSERDRMNGMVPQCEDCERPRSCNWCLMCVKHCKHVDFKCKKCYRLARQGKTCDYCVEKHAEAHFGIPVRHGIDPSTVAEFKKHFTNVTTKLADLANDGVVRRGLIGLPLLIAQLWRHRDPVDWTLNITAFLNTLGIVSRVIEWVIMKLKVCWDVAVEWMKKKKVTAADEPAVGREIDPIIMQQLREIEERRRQSPRVHSFGALDLGGVVGAIGGVIAVVFAAIGIQSIPACDKGITVFIQRFAYLGRCITSSEQIFEVGRKISDEISRLVRVYIMRQDPALVTRLYTENAWCDKVFALMTTDFEKNSRYNPQMRVKVEALLTEGSTLNKQMDAAKVPMTERTRFTRAMMMLYECRKVVSGSGAGGAEMRPVPIVVHLVGDTGCGKSSVLWPLCSDLGIKLGLESFEDVQKATYYRSVNQADDFWSGYHDGTQIVVVDDIFTVRDSENNPSKEATESIRMSNPAYWPLPMADVQDKGRVFFKSPVVLWTSNRSQWNFPSLTNPEAVYNRITVRFRVQPKAEYAKDVVIQGEKYKNLDGDKVAQAIADDPSKIKDLLEYIQLDPKSSTEREMTGERLSYDQFMEMCWERLEKALERFVDTKAANVTYFDQQIKKRVAAKTNRDTSPMRSAFDDEPDIEIPSVRPKIEPVFGKPGTVARVMANDATPVVGYLSEDEKAVVGYVKRCQQVLSAPKIEKPQWKPSSFPSTWRTWYNGEQHIDWRRTLLDNRQMLVKLANAVEVPEIIIDQGVGSCLAFVGPNSEVKVASALAAFLRAENSEEGEKAMRQVFGADYRQCSCLHESELTESLTLERFCALRMNVLHGQCSYILDEVAEAVITSEEKLSQYQPFIYLAVAAALALVSSLGAVVYYRKPIASGLSDFFKREKARTGELQSRADKTSGRVKGRVQAHEYPGLHEPDCLDAYYKFVSACEKITESEEYKATGPHQHHRDQYLELELAKLGVDDSWSCECSTRLGRDIHANIQSALDQNAKEVGVLACQNLYKLEKEMDGEFVHQVNVLFVRGRMAITNAHVLLSFGEPDTKWRIRNHTNSKGVEVLQRELKHSKMRDVCDRNKDFVMLEFPRCVNQHRDIVKKFVTYADQGAVAEFPHLCLTGYATTEQLVLRQYYTSKAQAMDGKVDLYDDQDKKVVTIRNFIEYDLPTSRGDCGAILTAYDTRLAHKILGYHAGGLTNGTGHVSYGQPVTRELLEKALVQFHPMNVEALVAAPDLECAAAHVYQRGVQLVPSQPQDGHMNVGRIASGAPHRNYKTTIVPSPIHGVIAEPVTAPAHLAPVVRDGERIDPMDLARVKVLPKPRVFVRDDLLERAIDDVSEMVNRRTLESDCRVFSREEAIKGIEGDPAYVGINRKSSPGFGWAKTNGKREYLGEDEWITDHPEIVDKVTRAVEKVTAGERIGAVFVDTLKDERRSLAKIAALKTRLFSAGEMIFTIVFRMFFLGIVGHMWRQKINIEACLGINSFGHEWHYLATKLTTKGSKVIAGDFTNYDGNLCPELLWGAFTVIERFYAQRSEPEENRRARRSLFSDVANSVHVVGSQVYIWPQSNPSGCPITAQLNCLVHSIMARYVYLTLAEKHCPTKADLASYYEHVVHVNYGDDDVWNISDDVSEWFNQITMTEAFAELGMTYTDEAKGKTQLPWRSLAEVQFLKRGFRFDEMCGRYVAPLHLPVIKEMPMWRHVTTDEYLDTVKVFEEAVCELALHGEEVFNQEIPAFKRAALILERRIPVHLWRYREALNIVNNRAFK